MSVKLSQWFFTDRNFDAREIIELNKISSLWKDYLLVSFIHPVYIVCVRFLNNIPVPRARPRIPKEAFSPGCTLVICQVEKGHRKIHRRNSHDAGEFK